MGGQLFDRDYLLIPTAAIADVVFASGDDAVFKRNATGRGKGIYRLRRTECANLNWNGLPDGVIQNWVKPHSFFDQLVPTGGPTIRVFTVLGPDGDVSVRASYLRLARQHQHSVNPDDAINVPIEMANGELVELGYRSSNLEAVARHPDTGCVFQGKVVPGFQELLHLRKKNEKNIR